MIMSDRFPLYRKLRISFICFYIVEDRFSFAYKETHIFARRGRKGRKDDQQVMNGFPCQNRRNQQKDKKKLKRKKHKLIDHLSYKN